MRRRIVSGAVLGRLASLLLLAFAIPGAAGPAAAADLRLAAAGPGVCGDAGVLASIRHRFAHGAERVEKRALDIVAVEKIRMVSDQTGRPSPIPRLYCRASVTLSDGTRSVLTFVVARGAGFAAPGLADATDEVEFCVAGHDRWRVHDGSCRTTRKFW